MMLDQRLLACAEYVRPHSMFCDIGTDHGHLPCYLAKQHKISHAIAADLNAQPLAFAQKTVEMFGLTGQVELILSDGLIGIPPEKADDIVIAGMGGELIAKIIGAVCWVKDPQKRLILQPMTQLPLLRRWLYQQGFLIQEETPVLEHGHFYSVFCCTYSGTCQEISEFDAWVGALQNSQHPNTRRYLQHQYERIQRIISGLESAKSNRQQAEGYYRLADEMARCLEKFQSEI